MGNSVMESGLDLSKYIEVRLFGERPHVRGRRVTVATIVHNATARGWSVAELAEHFELSEAEVLSALLYYEENRALVDAQEAAFRAEIEKMNWLYDQDN